MTDVYYEDTPVRVVVDDAPQTLTASYLATEIVDQVGVENLVGPPGRDAEIVFGATAGTVTEGDDARLSDARTPRGTAGGSLIGGYPSPTIRTGGVSSLTIADGAVTDRHLSALAGISESKLNLASDAAAATPSRRSLGTGAGQAAPGADAVGRAAYGTTATFPRPSGYAVVIWVGSGSVEPLNRSTGDLWVRTS